MSKNSLRLLANAAAAVFLVSSAAIQAQTTINLNTANGTCTATTDSAGLMSETAPGSTALRANGVTLSAGSQGACNPAGGSSSNFNASVALSGSPTPGAPYTPAIGSPFYVIWSASTDATACTYGGNFTSGISGWTLGQRACSDGASCATSHAVQVTPTAAGNYTFSVTCTNASGYATGAVNVPNPPVGAPTPNPITPMNAPATAGVGSTFAVTWPQMTNATTCDGTGTLDGVNAASLGDWTTLQTVSTTASNTRNVTVPANATVGSQLKLTLTCWNSDHTASATGSTGNITVAAATAGCPAAITTPDGARTLLTTSGISYGVYPTQRPGVNLSEWTNIWGYNDTTSSTPVAWPGVGGASPVIRQFTRTSYVGVHFKTGSNTAMTGSFKNPTFAPGPNVVMAISTACGDFSEHLPTAGCLADHLVGANPWTGIPTSDANMIQWKFTTNAPGSWCNLQPNTDYYVNMTFADHTDTGGGTPPECATTATTCNLAPVSYHN